MKKLLQASALFAITAILIICVNIGCKKKKENTTSTTPSCPTTSACGCSAKNKADCEASTDCCKWTTGSGCGCK